MAGRAGRGAEKGQVVVQTYWPDHPAIRAAADHDASIFYDLERVERSALGYPPYGRLANVLAWGRDRAQVAATAEDLAQRIRAAIPQGWEVLGPSPSPLARLKGVWRWHVLVKAPEAADVPGSLGPVLKSFKSHAEVSVACDVDPLDLL